MADNLQHPPEESTSPALASGAGDNPTKALKQRLEHTRLPAELKEKILAALPSPEERARLYRELKEQRGLALEEMLAGLDLAGLLKS